MPRKNPLCNIDIKRLSGHKQALKRGYMARLVLKFGGTSVADISRIRTAAEKVVREVQAGHQVAVVVSAMAGVTNALVDYCKTARANFDWSEYDAVVASGEQVTSGLMAIVLQDMGLKSRSYQGWQVPLITDTAFGRARIERIEPARLLADMAGGIVPVMAGFQGVTNEGRITTLGRGGSDTSAVALAAALQASRCDIYTDVDGVYTTDPRITDKARKLRHVTYEEMLELASVGAKVLQTRSVEMAMRHRVPVQVLSTFAPEIGSQLPGTTLTEEEIAVENQSVTGIAYSKDDAQITLRNVPDRPGVAAAIFTPLSEANINVDMIVQNVSAEGSTDLTFTVPKVDLARSVEALEAVRKDFGYDKVTTNSDVAKISVIGVGMRSHAGVASLMFRTLSARGINIRVISTSEIKISVLIDATYTELAVRSLHTAYGLDADA
jgi:aspartate kinase